jgi:molybdate transport system substrate-binding protein
VADLLARGEADLGFQQISELVHAKGIDYLGPLPNEIQKVTIWSAGLHSATSTPDAAKAFMKSLSAPESASIIKKTGMDPA